MDNQKRPVLRAPVEFDGLEGGADTTCSVTCKCGEDLFISETGKMCKCGRFYFTVFTIMYMDIDDYIEKHIEIHDGKVGWAVSDTKIAHLT